METSENIKHKKIAPSNQVKNQNNNNSHNQNDVEKFNYELTSYEIQISKLESKITDLENQPITHKQTLNDIKNSVGFKVLRFYGDNIDC